MALAGFVTIVLVLAAILSKKLSPLIAMVAIPVGAALLLGFGGQTNEFIVSGLVAIAPIAVMFIFAILFFGIMNDAKVFDPIVNSILRIVGTDPRKILPGTAILTAIVHLDGSGASTFLIAIPALKPLYEKLNIDLKLLACTAAMSAGVCNLLPWGGPTIRAASALNIPVLELYRPLIAVQASGFLFVLVTAYYLGKRAYRKQTLNLSAPANNNVCESKEAENNVVNDNMTKNTNTEFNKPQYFAANITLTLLVIGLMITGVLQPVVAFMCGVVAALLINYREIDSQAMCINNHAKTAISMAVILFAAGVFSGILKHSGMLAAMAQTGAEAMPSALSAQLPALLGFIAMPLSLLFDPDSFYFGILPVLAGIAAENNLPQAAVAQAALMGQMTTGFAVSPLTPATFLLVGLTGINLADHQRFTIPLLLITSWVMTLTAIVLGVFKA
ncbi:CitMHS family transporter [Halioxenophilus aromaticivorans]|uniref:Citrate:proton symporter n=1 Tax=Halioxenophilus aromaticivorans TaxID=1306992 RepID=A0AAV3U3T7_9ALTE